VAERRYRLLLSFIYFHVITFALRHSVVVIIKKIQTAVLILVSEYEVCK